MHRFQLLPFVVFGLLVPGHAAAKNLCPLMKQDVEDEILTVEVEQGDVIGSNCEVELKQSLVLQGADGVIVDVPMQTEDPKYFGLRIATGSNALSVTGIHFQFKKEALGGLHVQGHEDPNKRGKVRFVNVDIEDETEDTIEPEDDCPENKRYGVVLEEVGELYMERVHVWGPEHGKGQKAPPLQAGLLLSDGHHSAGQPDDVIRHSSFFVSCGLALVTARRRPSLEFVSVEEKGPCDWRPAALKTFVPQGR